jgi:hypothetical protein
LANEDYETGDTKISPDRRAVAIRSAMPDLPAFANSQWAVMTTDTGGYYAPFAQVEAWPDLAVVEVPDQPTE